MHKVDWDTDRLMLETSVHDLEVCLFLFFCSNNFDNEAPSQESERSLKAQLEQAQITPENATNCINEEAVKDREAVLREQLTDTFNVQLQELQDHNANLQSTIDALPETVVPKAEYDKLQVRSLLPLTFQTIWIIADHTSFLGIRNLSEAETRAGYSEHVGDP